MLFMELTFQTPQAVKKQEIKLNKLTTWPQSQLLMLESALDNHWTQPAPLSMPKTVFQKKSKYKNSENQSQDTAVSIEESRLIMSSV